MPHLVSSKPSLQNPTLLTQTRLASDVPTVHRLLSHSPHLTHSLHYLFPPLLICISLETSHLTPTPPQLVLMNIVHPPSLAPLRPSPSSTDSLDLALTGLPALLPSLKWPLLPRVLLAGGGRVRDHTDERTQRQQRGAMAGNSDQQGIPVTAPDSARLGPGFRTAWTLALLRPHLVYGPAHNHSPASKPRPLL